VTEIVRDTASPLLFHHSSRVYFFGALAGLHRGLKFDAELLYAGTMFHDMGLTRQHSIPNERFEVDGANAARDFLRARNIGHADIDTVWTAIAPHTTPLASGVERIRLLGAIASIEFVTRTCVTSAPKGLGIDHRPGPAKRAPLCTPSSPISRS
jgi:HD superfamily phosphodiesterase